jgi:hypothetical protein
VGALEQRTRPPGLLLHGERGMAGERGQARRGAPSLSYPKTPLHPYNRSRGGIDGAPVPTLLPRRRYSHAGGRSTAHVGGLLVRSKRGVTRRAVQLLRQPHGFEGLLTIGEYANAPDLGVGELVDVRGRRSGGHVMLGYSDSPTASRASTRSG